MTISTHPTPAAPPAFTSEQLQQLQGTCPPWCATGHQWEAEADFDGGAWPHSRNFGDVITITAILDAAGQLLKVEATPVDWDGQWDDDRMPDAAVELRDAATLYRQAADFTERLTTPR